MKTNMKEFVAEELYNKVYHLTKALKTSESIIKILEKENDNLKEILSSLNNHIDENNTSLLEV
jgi:hypothetical protein